MGRLGWFIPALLAAVACALVGPSDDSAKPPTKEPPLCQPFPDRLVDGLQQAYRRRDLEALRRLVRAPRIIDVLGAAHAGRVDFNTVAEWARGGWRSGDRIRGIGYTAFSPTRDGFLMHVVRESGGLREAGIDRVAMTLEARSTGCVIDVLRTRGPVQAFGEPCGFYDVFGAIPGVGTPGECLDGSARYARQGHAAVWTGREMLVWGGTTGAEFGHTHDSLATGLRYEPATGRWTETAKAPIDVRWAWRGVWTGEDLVAWGWSFDRRPAPARYDPESDTWILLPPWPLQEDSNPAGVWTGHELILWGSSQYTDEPMREGAVYDSGSDGWRLTAPAPIEGREGHSAVWTGREMIVWGGTNYRTDLGDGAAYDPETNVWRRIGEAPISPRKEHAAVWTGQEMIVWGGSSYSTPQADGAAYDPDTDSWRRVKESPLGPRHRLAGVWTGSRLLVWGGYDYHLTFSDGAAYDPVADAWAILPPAPIGPRCDHSAVWTGREMIVFGGDRGCGSVEGMPFGDGAAYRPSDGTWDRLIPVL